MDLPGKGLPEKVILFRALQLGDMLCVVPALRALRAALPQARITLVGLPWAREFVQRFNHYLDDFIEFPGYPGLPERPVEPQNIPPFLHKIQTSHYDLAVQMQGSGSISNPLVMLFGAQQTAGYALRGQYCPDPKFFLDYPVHLSETRRHLRLMEFLGFASQGEQLEFPLSQADKDEFVLVSREHGLKAGEFAVLHPGSRSIERRWPLERFAAVADHMSERGLQVVITGSADEAGLAAKFVSMTKVPVHNLAGQTSLGGVAALLSAARLVICNDTGISHIADALHIPSVVLFTASDPNRWAPRDSQLHRPISWASAALPSQVMDEVEVLLREEKAYAC